MKTITNFKNKMIAKAKKRGGIWENFGQKELRQLEDKHNYNSIKYSHEEKDKRTVQQLEELNKWCGSFDLSQL